MTAVTWLPAEMMTLIRRYQWGHCAKDGEA
jgi:hypothetical protein